MAGTRDLYWESIRSFLTPVVPWLDDSSVSEIMINGANSVFYETRGQLHKADISFNEQSLMAAARNIAQYVGKQMTEGTAHIAARLPDGSRVQVVLPPCSHSGVVIAIRKFSKFLLTLEKLVEYGSLTEKSARWLDILVNLQKNIIISGGTSSGKTSLLNVLGSLIPEGERVITMEDACELQIDRNHLVTMETQAAVPGSNREPVTMRDLVKVSLRLRPDRIIVGEVRGGEALDLLQAMSTGHSGSMGTLHANDPLGGLRRLETMATYGTSGEIPLSAIRSQVANAVEILVQANRLQDGSRHITYISEVLPLDMNGNYQMRHIFEFNVEGRDSDGRILGELRPTGQTSLYAEQAPLMGYDLEPEFFSP